MDMPYLTFDVITIFPNMFRGVLDESIVKRAMEKKLIEIKVTDLRTFTTDKHSSVDDYLFGGIPGMLMKCEPLSKAIRETKETRKELNPRVIYLTPQGSLLNHERVKMLSKERSLIILCGRYKGIDHRIEESLIDDEISVGDYVVSGGELPAMILIDAITRFIPGSLSSIESAESDSLYNGLLEPPNYTRPELFENMRVPEVLLSGHHEKIKEWRFNQSIVETKKKRPDLYEAWLNIHKDN